MLPSGWPRKQVSQRLHRPRNPATAERRHTTHSSRYLSDCERIFAAFSTDIIGFIGVPGFINATTPQIDQLPLVADVAARAYQPKSCRAKICWSLVENGYNPGAAHLAAPIAHKPETRPETHDHLPRLCALVSLSTRGSASPDDLALPLTTWPQALTQKFRNRETIRPRRISRIFCYEISENATGCFRITNGLRRWKN